METANEKASLNWYSDEVRAAIGSRSVCQRLREDFQGLVIKPLNAN